MQLLWEVHDVCFYLVFPFVLLWEFLHKALPDDLSFSSREQIPSCHPHLLSSQISISGFFIPLCCWETGCPTLHPVRNRCIQFMATSPYPNPTSTSWWHLYVQRLVLYLAISYAVSRMMGQAVYSLIVWVSSIVQYIYIYITLILSLGTSCLALVIKYYFPRSQYLTYKYAWRCMEEQEIPKYCQNCWHRRWWNGYTWSEYNIIVGYMTNA